MVEKTRLKKILDQFSDKKIAVVGDMMLDEYIIGEVSRISPEAPVQVVNIKSESFVLGGAANVVNNLSSLGAKVFSYSVVGDDEKGKKLQRYLTKKGASIEGIFEDQDRPTIVKKRIIARNQQLLRLDWEDKKEIVLTLEDQIINSLRENLENLDAIILSDYDKGVLTKGLVSKVIKMAKESGTIVVVDPKPRNRNNYIGATSMTPNHIEAMECAKKDRIESEDEFVEMGKQLKKDLELDNILITRGEKGMSLFEDNEIEYIETVAKEVYDVTGAGDTVISVYTLASVCDASLYEAAKIANTAAGIVVGRMGTSVVTKSEILKFYED
ncbi:MAG: D-glycero-beta-D-manno-heptose-7-phosphate kinase [Fusobacteriota bacterium]